MNLISDIWLSVMWQRDPQPFQRGAASFLMWADGAEGQKAHYALEFAGHKKDVHGFGTDEAVS